jgi:hypothetical protein
MACIPGIEATLYYHARTMTCSHESMEGLSVETVSGEGNCRNLQLIYQRPVYCVV